MAIILPYEGKVAGSSPARRTNFMKIRVMSEQMIREYNCDVTHAIISIRSPSAIGKGKPVTLPKNKKRHDVLYLVFHDVDDSSRFAGLYDRFEESDAQKICKFVEKNILVDTLICQCEAGISRSAGVAAAISKHLYGEDSFFFKNYLPNRRVYRMLLEELHTEPSKDLDKYDFKDNGKGLLVRFTE